MIHIYGLDRRLAGLMMRMKGHSNVWNGLLYVADLTVIVLRRSVHICRRWVEKKPAEIGLKISAAFVIHPSWLSVKSLSSASSRLILLPELYFSCIPSQSPLHPLQPCLKGPKRTFVEPH